MLITGHPLAIASTCTSPNPSLRAVLGNQTAVAARYAPSQFVVPGATVEHHAVRDTEFRRSGLQLRFHRPGADHEQRAGHVAKRVERDGSPL